MECADRASNNCAMAGQFDVAVTVIVHLTTRLSGARSPQHRAMALYRHVIPFMAQRSRSAWPLQLVRHVETNSRARPVVSQEPRWRRRSGVERARRPGPLWSCVAGAVHLCDRQAFLRCPARLDLRPVRSAPPTGRACYWPWPNTGASVTTGKSWLSG